MVIAVWYAAQASLSDWHPCAVQTFRIYFRHFFTIIFCAITILFRHKAHQSRRQSPNRAYPAACAELLEFNYFGGTKNIPGINLI